MDEQRFIYNYNIRYKIGNKKEAKLLEKCHEHDVVNDNFEIYKYENGDKILVFTIPYKDLIEVNVALLGTKLTDRD